MNTPPLRLIVMGVAGCGKTTLAQALGERVGLAVADGDDLHLPQSIKKMRAGIPLQDNDRWPWLDRIGAHLCEPHAHGRVVACSALKRAYRDRLRAKAGDVFFIFLNGDFDLIGQRMRQRQGHYMPLDLLESQFRTLERPQPDEYDVIELPITEAIDDLVHLAWTAAQKKHSHSPPSTPQIPP
jgi:carbohydrate kinase (thermoresistant glucokinase family)